MDIFTKKLRLIYHKLFQNNIDEFTKAFIDDNKFNIDKFDTKIEKEAYEQFLFNRKIVLRRWLKNGIKCTRDFQKSFYNYKISKYKYNLEPLFSLDDFKNSDNFIEFEKRVDDYIKKQTRVHTPIDYKYIYLFDDSLESLYFYNIVEWKKGDGFEMIIELSSNQEKIDGKVYLEDDGNIFMILNTPHTKQYLLFHDNNDNYSKYTVGISTGFSPKDNKVPIAKKVILSKEILDIKELDLRLILNNTEVIYATENRISNFDINPLIKYSQRLKRYYQLFFEIVNNRFKQNLYYRLVLKEFNSFIKLFEKVIKGDSYFVYNYHIAFYEMIKTLESIKNTPLYMVQELTSKHYLVQADYQDIKVQEELFNLINYGIEINLIVVINSKITKEIDLAIKKISKKGIKVRIVDREKIIHQVNSIDFAFIKTDTKNDFVLADPLRDSKDVYKIFTNSVTMEEYYSDYHKILINSKAYEIID